MYEKVVKKSFAVNRIIRYFFNMNEKHRGGKREGAGRKPEGKERFTVSLTAANVKAAKARGINFSGLLDRLLAKWLSS
jgi:hypothetical protein